jgi:hypothetical protein
VTRGAAIVLLMLSVSVVACSDKGSSAASSTRTSPSNSPLAKASGALDAEVPMPEDFPPDVPIYTGARLTSGASFKSTGQEAWGMEWETLDGVAKVQAFFAKQLNQGDWTITFKDSPSGTFTAVYSRKSNSKVSGTLAANADGGVTKILLSLVSPR